MRSPGPIERRAPAALIAILAGMILPSLARAEPSEDRALATTLFNEARTLMADGKVPEACRKLEESRRLDPLGGTILNLAVCHEKEGLMASAFSEFREARVLAERDRRDDRVALADEHLKAIDSKISKLVIVVGADADLPDLRITRDSTPLGRAAWGIRVPVDPGEHVIEASAPNKKTWRVVLNVLPAGDVQTAVVTPLEDAPTPPPAVAADAAPQLARNAGSRDMPGGTSGLSTRRTIALASAGLGVIGLGVGSYFGLRAISKHGDSDVICTTTPCSPESVSVNDDAKVAADVATVSFAVGLVGLGAAAFLWFGETSARPPTQLRLQPTWQPGGGYVAVSAAF